MLITSLKNTPYFNIHTTFLKAFSDYQLPIKITEKQLKFENIQKGVDLNSSFGAFNDNGELIGFILCGKQVKGKVPIYYNGATGVVPSYRGRHIGTKLLETAINDSIYNKANSFILEVLNENVKAYNLYNSKGFFKTKDLLCYQKSIESIEDYNTNLYSLLTPTLNEFELILSKLSLPFEPSWQNSFFAVSNIFDSLVIKVLCKQNKKIGFIVLNPNTGQILQISAKDNSLKIIKTLIYFAKSITKTDKLRFINIDSNSLLSSILCNNEWELFAKQFEMQLKVALYTTINK